MNSKMSTSTGTTITNDVLEESTLFHNVPDSTAVPQMLIFMGVGVGLAAASILVSRLASYLIQRRSLKQNRKKGTSLFSALNSSNPMNVLSKAGKAIRLESIDHQHDSPLDIIDATKSKTRVSGQSSVTKKNIEPPSETSKSDICPGKGNKKTLKRQDAQVRSTDNNYKAPSLYFNRMTSTEYSHLEKEDVDEMPSIRHKAGLTRQIKLTISSIVDDVRVYSEIVSTPITGRKALNASSSSAGDDTEILYASTSLNS